MTSNPSNVTSLNSITKNKSAVVNTNTNTVTTSVSPTTTKDLRNAFVNAVETAIKTNKTNEPKAKSIIKSYMNALAADVAATAEVIKAKEELEAVAVETAAAAKVVTNAPGDTDAQNTYKEIAIELRYGALRKYIQEIISAFKKLKNKEEDPLWAWGDARTSSIPSNTEAVLRYLILDPYYANPEAEAMAAVAEAEYKRSEMPYDEVTKAVAEAEEAKKKVDEANKNTSPEELKTLKNDANYFASRAEDSRRDAEPEMEAIVAAARDWRQLKDESILKNLIHELIDVPKERISQISNTLVKPTRKSNTASAHKVSLNEYLKNYSASQINNNNNNTNIIKLVRLANTTRYNFINKPNELNRLDEDAILEYTEHAYVTVNNFLFTNTNITQDDIKKANITYIYKWIQDRFPRNSHESEYDYNKRLVYYYFVNLFNAIGKIKDTTNKPIKVYRGTKTWYLEENRDMFYYINSFSSTSITSSATDSFALASKKEKNKEGNEERQLRGNYYVFYIDPNCSFIPINNSAYPGESEILLNPYHRYVYITETNKNDGYDVYKHFLILPIDIDIPTTYETFMPWKEGIVDKTIILKNGKAVSPPVPLPAVSVSLPVPLPALSVVKAAAITEGGRVISTVPGMLRHRTLKNTKVRGKTIKNRTLEKGRASARARTNKKLNSRQTPKKAINKVQHRTLKMEPDKVNTSKKLLLGGAPKKPMYNENTIRRFTDPIPSFPGKALTSAEKKMIEKLKEEIIKNEKK